MGCKVGDVCVLLLKWVEVCMVIVRVNKGKWGISEEDEILEQLGFH